MAKRVYISAYDYPAIVDSFKRMGWEVFAGDKRNWSAWCHGNIDDIPKSTPQQFGQFFREELRQIKPDLVIIGKGLDSNCPAPTEPPFWYIQKEDIEFAKSLDCIVIQLTLDSPDDFGMSTNCGIPRVVHSIGTCCIGTREFYKRHTEADIWEFWPAFDTVLRTSPPRNPVVDIIIVGSPYFNPNAEFGLPRKDIAKAAIELGLSLEIYGPNWLSIDHGGDPALESYYRGMAKWEDLHNVYARGKIAYNSFLRQGFRYLNDRVPIVAGAGVFLLMEEQLGLEGEFREGSMVGYHKRGDIEDVKAAMTRWIKDDTGRENAARNMQKYILENHTYLHRAKTIEAAYERAIGRLNAAKKRKCCGQAASSN